MISTKGRYALRVMIDLAQQGREQCVPLKDIAERQEISKKYLEIIVRDLVKAKLIRGSSGKGGGYVLCRAPENITIWEILEKTEGTLAPVACLAEDAEACPRAAGCRTLPLWSDLNALIRGYLTTKTLYEVAEMDTEPGGPAET